MAKRKRSGLKQATDFLDRLNRLLETSRDLANDPRIQAFWEQVKSAREAGSQSYDPFLELGVNPRASKEEVDKVYEVKMRFAHPDAGGSDERAARLNRARDEIYRINGWS